MLRLLGILVTVLCAVAVAVLTWPGFFRVERVYPVAQLVSFRGVMVLAFAFLAAIFFFAADQAMAWAVELILGIGR